MTEAGEIVVGDSIIRYTVTRSERRRKTVAVRLDGAGGVRVMAPAATAAAQIRDVVSRHAGWILRRLADAAPQAPMTDIVTGAALPYLGRAVSVNVTDAAVLAVRVSLDGNMLAIAVPHRLGGNGRTAAIRGALVNWYRGIAAEHLRRSVEHWAEVMQVTPGRVLVRDQRRRWGSCAPDGTLRFNWRIIMTDEAVFEYVVVHELAHLAHRDHGQDFWAAVGRVIPDHRARRRKLREAGASLPL